MDTEQEFQDMGYGRGIAGKAKARKPKSTEKRHGSMARKVEKKRKQARKGGKR